MIDKDEEKFGTTIRLSKTCREALLKYGDMGDSYEDVLWKLMKAYKRK